MQAVPISRVLSHHALLIAKRLQLPPDRRVAIIATLECFRREELLEPADEADVNLVGTAANEGLGILSA
jgi:hypothetical protein